MKNTLFSSENKDLKLLFTLDVDTELSMILRKAFELYRRYPRIERLIARDLDAYGMEKKKERLLMLPGSGCKLFFLVLIIWNP